MRNYIFLLFLFLIILSSFVLGYKIYRIIEKQGLANPNSDYIPPEIIRNLITDQQNQDIIHYASSRFSPSVVGGGLNNIVDGEIRRSQTAWITKETPIVRDIIQKICNKYKLPFENCEDLQVVKYEKEHYYKEHHDSFPYYEPDFLFQGGHRMLTCLIYLNENFDGGETYFPNLDLKIKPAKNCAVVFHPLDTANKKCHPKALHAGMPVKSGTKYICNLWIRETPYQYQIDEKDPDFIFNKTVLSIYRNFI
jgi:prolyl 4-hydroxylase